MVVFFVSKYKEKRANEKLTSMRLERRGGCEPFRKRHLRVTLTEPPAKKKGEKKLFVTGKGNHGQRGFDEMSLVGGEILNGRFENLKA